MKTALSASTLLCFHHVFAAALVFGRSSPESLAAFVLRNDSENPGNFLGIFNDPELKDQFFYFLKNVYNIYPEKEFHELIARLTQEKKSDSEIYVAILANLKHIKPFLSELTYSLPALAKQKEEIANQTMQLLGDRQSISGYLEIGTPGRYISEIKDRVEVKGDVALVNVTQPSYSPIDIAERGQIFKLGRYIPLNDYSPISIEHAADSSFEVVTNYIGFHHSPLERLDDFIRSINRVLKSGGSLILRDHDVTDQRMNYMVALAHDVFNAGLNVNWELNHKELRHFRPLSQWVTKLHDHGFEFKGKMILQEGDPTMNTLMEFQKV